MGFLGDIYSVSCDLFQCLDGLLAVLHSPNMVAMTTVVSHYVSVVTNDGLLYNNAVIVI